MRAGSTLINEPVGRKRSRTAVARFWLGAIGVVAGIGALGYTVGRQKSHALQAIRAKETVTASGFQPSHIDLGSHLWGSEVPFSLRFMNGGPTPLVLGSVGSSCGCAVVERERYEGLTLAPGESLTIDGVMRTEAATGRCRAAVTVTDGEGTAYAANVSVEVVGTWRLSEADIQVDDIVLGEGDAEAFSRLVVFSSNQDELLDVKPMCDWLEVRVARRESGPVEILLRGLRERLWPGCNVANVIVCTNNAVKPEGTIYIKVWAAPALEPTPSHVSLLGTAAQRASFHAHDGGPVELVAADSTDGAVVARIVSEDTIEVVNTSGAIMPEIVTVKVTDHVGRSSTVQVSTFANRGERP